MSHHIPIPSWLQKGYALLFALLPWSIDCNFGSWNLTIPSEPLIAFLGLGLVWVIATHPTNISKAISPVNLPAIALTSLSWIAWMGISAFFSTMPVVSLKYWLVEAGHWWVLGAGMVIWPGLWRKVLPYFAVSMTGVAFYTMAHHGFFDFRADQALLAPMPFFPDHTMYAAVLAMLFFFVLIPGETGVAGFHLNARAKYTLAGILGVALMVSTCRAALLSLLATGMVGVGYYFRKKPGFLALGALVLGLLMYPLAGDKISGSFSSDVSFQERLNRWDCARSMLHARASTGFGPGTYPFQYEPFQQPEKMTRISVREPLLQRGPDTYGRGGGAHSEYWQAAAEMGWPGVVIWIALVISALLTGFYQCFKSPQQTERRIALFIALGLLTYFIHALANNFLHDGRVAALFWGAMASIVQFRCTSISTPSIHQ